MAKNTTKFPQSPGTNTSGAIKVLDLSSLDDDLFADIEDPKPAGIVESLKTGFKEGFLGSFNSVSILRSFVKSAAPEGFSRLFGAYDSLMDSVGETKSYIEKTNAGDLLLFAQKTNSLLPYLKDKIPSALYGKISSSLEATVDEYKYEVESQERYSPIRQRRDADKAKEEARENTIREALDHSSLVTRTSFMRQEQGEVAREARRSAEGSIRDSIGKGRFDFISKALSMSTDSLTRLAAYTEQVQYGMQRKGLELQFRTVLGIKDLIHLQSESLKFQDTAFKALVRNTGLPDHKKKNYKELMEMGSLKGGVKKVGKEAFKSLPMWLAGYKGMATDKGKKSIGSALGNAAQAIRMGETAPVGDLWNERYSILGSEIGERSSNFIRDGVAPWMGRQVRPEMEKLGDAYLGGKQHQTSYLLDNIPALLSEYVTDNKERGFLGNQLKDFLEPLVPRYDRKTTVDIGGFGNINEMASFNEITQRSIVDVIPGYLSRILQELRIFRTGDEDISREVYDITSGQFTDHSTAKGNLLAKFLTSSNIENTTTATNDAIDEIDKDKTLSDKAKEVLSERLIREANSNTRFNPEKFITKQGFGQDADKETILEINKHFKDNFKFNDKGELLPIADNLKRRNAISDKFLDIKHTTVDPAREILALIESGNTSMLREMGLLTTERGIDKLNYKQIWGILGSGKKKSSIKDKVADKAEDGIDKLKEKFSQKWSGGTDYLSGAFKTASDAAKSATDYAPKGFNVKGWGMGGYGKSSKPTLFDRATEGFGNLTVPDSLNVKGSDLAGKAKDTANSLLERTSGAIDNLPKGSDLNNLFNLSNLTDLWSASRKDEPLIKGLDLALGDMYDALTGKVITKFNDITGPVINKIGNMVMTPSDLKSGVWTQKGQKLDLSIKVGSPLDYAAVSGYRPKPIVEAANEKLKVNDVDWYFESYDDPVITVKGLAEGEYFDVEGKNISDINDIKGPVYNREAVQIVTRENLEEGLWNKVNSERIKITKGDKAGKLIGALDTYFKTDTSALIMAGGKRLAKTLLGAGLKVFNAVKSNRDGYYEGEKDPILSVADLKAGKYYNAKGNVIETFYDHYGPVHDTEGNILVSEENQKLLINIDGTKHQLAKNRGLLSQSVGRLSKWYGKKSAQYMKWATKKTLSAYGKVFGKIPGLGGLFKTGDKAVKGLFERSGLKDAEPTGTDIILGQILSTLKAQAPEKLREGGWRDQAAKKATELKDKAKVVAKPKKGKGLLGTLGALKGLFLGDKDEDEGYGLSDGLEDAANADSLLGGDKNGSPRRRGGRNNRPRGRFGKALGKLKNSRIGRSGIGRVVGGLAKGVANVGRVAMIAAPILGKGLLMAGSGLLSALTSPVVLGGLAVAGVAAGGYYGYKYLSNKNAAKGDFRQLRLMQYGFSSVSEQTKILELEDYLEDYVAKSEDSVISMDNKAVVKVLEIFDIDPSKDIDRIQALQSFIEYRFKPVYLRYINTLVKIGQKSVKINAIDGSLKDEFKLKFLTAVTEGFGEINLFDPIVNPFGKKGDVLESSRSQYDKYVATLEVKFGKATELAKPSIVESAAITAGAAGVLPMANVSSMPRTTSPVDRINVGEKEKWKQETLAKIASQGGVAIDITKEGFKSGTLTSFEAIRLRAYGLETLTANDITRLLRLEAGALSLVRVNGSIVEIVDDDDELLKICGVMFGLSVGNDEKGQLTRTWLRDRFFPVVKALYSGMLDIGVKDLKAVKEKTQLLSVSGRVIGARTSDNREVWEVPSVFKVASGLKALKAFADTELDAITAMGDKDILGTPTMSASAQVGAKVASETGNTESFVSKLTSAAKSAFNTYKDGAVSVSDYITGSVKNAMYSVAGAVGIGDAGKFEGGAQASLTEGNGGAWDKIPYPTSNKNAKAAKATFLYIEQMTGVPAVLLHIFCSMESSFNYTATNNTSSATGWFQFLNATWDTMLRLHGKKFGVPADTPDRKLRLDPRLNALMGAMFIKDNAAGLKRGLKREPTDVDLYCAHFMGLAGAVGFLSNNPNAIAALKYPKQAQANQPTFYTPAKRPRTFGQIYQVWEAKVAAHRKTWDGSPSDVVKPANPDEVKAESVDGKTEVELPDTDVAVVAGSGDISEKSDSTEVAAGGPSSPVIKMSAQEKALADAEVYDINKIASDKMTSPISATPSNYNYAAKPKPEEAVTDTVAIGKSVSRPVIESAPVEAIEDPRLVNAKKMNALREAEVRSTTDRTAELIDIQRQQLDAVMDMKVNLRQLVAMKTEESTRKVTASTPTTPTQQSRASASIKGLVPLR